MRTPGCLAGAAAFVGLGALGVGFLVLDWLQVLPAVVGASAGVILLIVACSAPVVILLRQEDRAAADYRRVLTTGRQAIATVAALQPDPGGTIVVARGTNPLTGEPCEFISPPLPEGQPPPTVGATVAIAVDPTDPERGVMDLDRGDRAPGGWTRCRPSRA
jgi:hypothetical protein